MKSTKELVRGYGGRSDDGLPQFWPRLSVGDIGSEFTNHPDGSPRCMLGWIEAMTESVWVMDTLKVAIKTAARKWCKVMGINAYSDSLPYMNDHLLKLEGRVWVWNEAGTQLREEFPGSFKLKE